MSATLAISPAATLLRPPTPEPAPDDLTPLQVAIRMRRNGISVWARRAYEDDIVIRRFFGRRSLLINAPEGIRNVLIDRTDKYVRTTASIRILRPMLGEGLLLSEGRAWRHQRRTLAPAFSPKAISLLVPHMLSAADEAVAALRARSSESVDLFSALQRLTLEIAGRTMFSLEMKESGGRLREFVMRYSRRLARPHLLDLLLPLDIPSPHDVARFWFRRQWRAFLDGIIRKRREAASSAGVPRDLFDLLLAARDPESGQSFSADQLRDQVATLILAGHETTAIALFWSLYLLALSPDTQEQLAEESVCAGEARGLEAFVRTRAVLDEAMRLYPPAFVIARAAREPDEVCGVRVEPGDLAIVSPWVLHRHRRHWSDPDAFRPERFLPGGPAIDRFAYLPFGVGPRICIGAQFALTEATLVLSRLLGSFRIELVDTAPVVPVAVVTTQPDRHPLFRLTPR